MRLPGGARMIYKHVVHPWPPVEDARSRILILGTLPSPTSLRIGYYYQHPQNAFWDIMDALYGAGRDRRPNERADILRYHKVAIWDVLKEADASGAADTNIVNPVPQDFNAFIHAHPELRAILFNGGKAEHLWRRLVDPTLDEAVLRRKIRVFRLPSTSPAHARSFNEKFAAWKQTITEALQ